MSKAGKAVRSQFVICVERGSYRIDLQIGKVYRTAAQEHNDPPEMVRVIDDSGEDYLYPTEWFVAVDLPAKAKRKLKALV